jgi:mono/diheme cytochrome c family protein
MRNQMILACVATALLGACVGGIDTPTGPGDDDQPSGTPREMFDSSVLPKLAKCVACHQGPETSATNMFVGPEGLASAYDTLVKDRAVNGGFNPDAATILLKGKHDGPAWSPSEADAIAKWLTAELAARGPQNPDNGNTGTKSPRTASMMFAACISASLTEYTQLQAYQVANMNTENGRCRQCHAPGGAGGQYLGVDANNQTYKDMFGKWQQEVFFLGVFQPQLQGDGTYKIGAAETKICNKGQEKDNNLGTHPTFDCKQNNSLGLTNLKKFVTAVQMKVDMADPTCPTPPAFAPPTP